MLAVDAEPVSEQDAAVWAAGILRVRRIEGAMATIEDLAKATNAREPAQSVIVNNTLVLCAALTQAVRRAMH